MAFMYGYGVVTDSDWATADDILALLDLAPKYKEENLSDMEDFLADERVSSFRDMDPIAAKNALLEILRDEWEFEGIHVILSRVIEEAEGIKLDAVTEGNCEFLVLDIRNPWNTPANVKNISEEQINGIFRKYITMVTDEDVTIDNYFI